MDNVKLQNHHDCRSDLMFQSMHLETVALEHHLGTGRMSYSLEDRLHLSGIETGLRHEDIERDR